MCGKPEEDEAAMCSFLMVRCAEPALGKGRDWGVRVRDWAAKGAGTRGFGAGCVSGECGQQFLRMLGWTKAFGSRRQVCCRQEPEESHRGRLVIPAGEQRRIWWITSF